MYVPTDLAYGSRGGPPMIPPESLLVFTMEIVEILGDDKVLAVRCDPKTKEKCSDKEVTDIEKIAAWDQERKEKELKRIQRMYESDSKPDLIAWMNRRLAILRKVTAVDEAKEEL
jgi:hypothetical protein